MEDIIYFELNHWESGKYYPDAEPFESWMYDSYDTKEEEEKSWIREPSIMDKWYKDNELCVVISTVDMSINFCVTAKRSWIEENCPELLTKYKKFLRYPDENGKLMGTYGGHFVEWSKENCGLYYDIDIIDDNGYYTGYELERYKQKNK